MSLLTKYRPQDFNQIVGQDAVVRSLEDAINNKRGTAYLFGGPSGFGKTTLARICARRLGAAPIAIEEVDAATNTGIDDMRAVTADLIYKPLDGSIKAVIVDEVHALSKNAVTSLLKILEEPPPWVYWFLCTTDPDRLPVAIHTRCLVYHLKPVPWKELYKLLDVEEASETPDDVLKLCAQEAGGSPRQALSNLGVCLKARSVEEASELLRSALESPEAINLVRALVMRAGWGEVQDILARLKETDAESIRHVVRAYLTKVVLGAKTEREAGETMMLLDLFAQPFYSRDGITPVVMACGRWLLTGHGEKPPF